MSVPAPATSRSGWDYRSPVRVAPFGIVLDDLVLSGEAVMRSER